MSTPDRIRPVVEPVLAHLGFVVDDITVTPAGKRRVVRVAVDRDIPAEGDIVATVPSLTLDEISAATHAIIGALDDTDVMGESAYVLEVTSPGVGRPLTSPAHFRHNVGRLVVLTTDSGKVTARIDRAGETALVARVLGPPERIVEMPYAAIRKALVQVEFDRPDADEPAADEPDTDATEKE